MRTLVSVRLQKRQNKVEERASRKSLGNDIKGENLHLGADQGPLHRVVRRSLLGGCTLGANRLGGCPTSIHRFDSDTALPRLLEGYSFDLPMAGVGPWPPPVARETCTSEAPSPRIIND
jgi:hypothetical protein